MNLINRPRRLRNGALLRSMVRETRISADTLIYPMFVQDGENIREEIPSMPGQYRWSLDRVDELLPVSYTHIDVYKRQHTCRTGK